MHVARCKNVAAVKYLRVESNANRFPNAQKSVRSERETQRKEEERGRIICAADQNHCNILLAIHLHQQRQLGATRMRGQRGEGSRSSFLFIVIVVAVADAAVCCLWFAALRLRVLLLLFTVF